MLCLGTPFSVPTLVWYTEYFLICFCYQIVDYLGFRLLAVRYLKCTPLYLPNSFLAQFASN